MSYLLCPMSYVLSIYNLICLLIIFSYAILYYCLLYTYTHIHIYQSVTLHGLEVLEIVSQTVDSVVVSMYVCVCMCVCKCVCVYVCIYVCVCVCMYLCVLEIVSQTVDSVVVRVIYKSYCLMSYVLLLHCLTVLLSYYVT
jgi:hypothetical protein